MGAFQYSDATRIQSSFSEVTLPLFGLFPFSRTMAGFEDSRPKTQAWNLAPAVAILFQFQKSQHLVHDPQCFEPWKQEFLEKE